MHTLLILHTQYKEEWETVLFWRKSIKYWSKEFKTDRVMTWLSSFEGDVLLLAIDCERNALEKLMQRMN